MRELHIASLVVWARPERLDEIGAAIATIDDAELHGRSEEGRLVVTLETSDQQGLVDALAAIRAFPGVLDASVVFHGVADALPDPGPDNGPDAGPDPGHDVNHRRDAA